MFYLEVAHADDEDCDLFKFHSLNRAFEYIEQEKLEEWQLSDCQRGYFSESDYTEIDE